MFEQNTHSIIPPNKANNNIISSLNSMNLMSSFSSNMFFTLCRISVNKLQLMIEDIFSSQIFHSILSKREKPLTLVLLFPSSYQKMAVFAKSSFGKRDSLESLAHLFC